MSPVIPPTSPPTIEEIRQGWLTSPPAVHHETILEWWANRPAACLFMLATLALGAAFVALGESLMDGKVGLRRRVRARRISIGALHTAVWSLAIAIYLTIGPDVGVIPVDGASWIAMAGLAGTGGLIHYAWADDPMISR